MSDTDDRKDEPDTEMQYCQHREHRDEEVPAVGVYEGIKPPATAFRFAACSEHAPDIQPIRYLNEQLPSGVRDESP